MKPHAHDHHRASLTPFLIAVVTLVLSWGLYWWLVVRTIPSDTTGGWSVRGQFGDMFGAFTALITALGFAGLLYGIHLQRGDIQRQTKTIRTQDLIATLTAQIATLVQIQAMPDERRDAVWKAIASAPGGPGANFPIERAIAIQIEYLDHLAQGEDITVIPTYGGRPKPAEG
jgi:hypothetical protein